MSDTPTYDKLKWRLKRFVDALIDTSGNASEAMRRIGFTGLRPAIAGSKLRRKPKVQAAYEERQALAVKIAGRTQAEILTVIGDTMDRCRQAVPLLDKFGKPVLIETAEGTLSPAYVFDAKNVLKAAELLGRYHKLFPTQNQHQQLDANGNPITPGPTFVIAREEANQIAEDLDNKV